MIVRYLLNNNFSKYTELYMVLTDCVAPFEQDL